MSALLKCVRLNPFNGLWAARLAKGGGGADLSPYAVTTIFHRFDLKANVILIFTIALVM